MKKRRFCNRELSYLDFNERVSDAAKNKNTPILERAKFFAISLSNLIEFYSVRVSSLKNEKNEGKGGSQTDEILKEINRRVSLFFKNYGKNLQKYLISPFRKKGFTYTSSFTRGEKLELRPFFMRILRDIHPIEIDDSSAPLLKTGTLYIAFMPKNNRLYAYALVKNENFPIKFTGEKEKITCLSDVILNFAPLIRREFKKSNTSLFIIIRNGDIKADSETTDFVSDMRRVLRERKISDAVSLIHSSGNRLISSRLIDILHIEKQNVFSSRLFYLPFIFSRLSSFPQTRELRYLKHTPATLPSYKDEKLIDSLEKQDKLVHFPYESFEIVLKFLEEAVNDKRVFEINMTIYRTNKSSPIIRLLKEAALSGKKVTAVVEIKARGDEARNISFGEELERCGVKVVYGMKGVKIHAKLLLIKRRGEQNETLMAMNLSTGNYNAKTAREYADLSLFTADKVMCLEGERIFRAISEGDVSKLSTKKIITSPLSMKNFLLEKIDREINFAKGGKEALLIVKVNSLTDKDMVKSLHKASAEGVRLLLNVRSSCTLTLEGKKTKTSPYIISVVDRFLEHARIIYFRNGGEEEIYLSSADWMERNLQRRVELLFPVTQKREKERVKRILLSYFECTKNAWRLYPDGKWKKLKDKSESAQETFLHSVK